MAKKILCLFFILIAPALCAAAPAGQVVDLQGMVLVTTAGQKPAPAVFKQPIYTGDIIETKETGAVKILFSDDTLLTLKENSKTIITEFLFQPESKERRVVFNVLIGKARTVVSRFFGADQTVEIKTPNAVAGIRGTDVGILVKRTKVLKKLKNEFITLFYCFDGVFNAFNIANPDQSIEVTKGNAVEIMENSAPLEFPIPKEIFENQGQFDIAVGSKSASGQLASQATESLTQEDTSAVAAAVTTASTSLQSLQTALNSQDTLLSALTDSDPSTGILPNPNNAAQNSNPVTITVTLP